MRTMVKRHHESMGARDGWVASVAEPFKYEVEA
jgi:hypothetical protein